MKTEEPQKRLKTPPTMGYTDAILDGMDEIAKHTRDGGKVVRGLITEIRRLQRERDEARKVAFAEAAELAKKSRFTDGPLGTIEGQIARAIHALAGK